MMDHEANIESIRTLEKQIGEGKGDIIKLKRARNSLLNISTCVPPEILGQVFAWSLAREADRSLRSPTHFTGFRKGSYNFLLVCHHWFEVASRTPEVWSFWGNTLQDWKKRHHRSGAAPLDLVLYGPGCDRDAFFDGPLRDAVRSLVVQDAVRQVHLWSYGPIDLTSIVSSLTPNDEGGKNENVESIVWRNGMATPVDLSNFFARSRLSKLRLLSLSGYFDISSWNCLSSRTTHLTALSLEITKYPSSTSPTASQLYSILTSNPSLQELRLSGAALPNDIDRPAFQVPLQGLKVLSLRGKLGCLFALLRRLVLPQALDEMCLTAFEPTVEDISRTLTPYMRDYFGRNARFQDPLEISTSSSGYQISIEVGVVCAQAGAPAPRVSLAIDLVFPPPRNVLRKLFLNLIAPAPWELVVSFTSVLHMKLPESLLFVMPNINTLSIRGVKLTRGFLRLNPDEPDPKTKLLPSLRWLSLGDVTPSDGNWGHLTTYLAHQTSDDQIISLTMFGDVPDIPPEVANEIEDLVEEFIYPQTPGVEVDE